MRGRSIPEGLGTAVGEAGGALLCALIVLILLWSAPVRAGAPADEELSRAVAAYEITLDRAERVARCMDDLGAWALRNPAEVKRINRKVGQGAPLGRTLQVMEAEPALQERIARHGTTARDLVLLPLALFAAQGWTEGSSPGGTPPAVNLVNVRFLAEHREAVAHLFEHYDENQQALAVR